MQQASLTAQKLMRSCSPAAGRCPRRSTRSITWARRRPALADLQSQEACQALLQPAGTALALPRHLGILASRVIPHTRGMGAMLQHCRLN
jgi:hypothetical protein